MTTLNTTRFRNPLPAIGALLTNPVVVRDLRAQMRGTKSYWYQGAYLLLLGILAICGYAMATQQGTGVWSTTDRAHISIIQAQSSLEGFYNFIFLTLAALISLIAPALTAASIVGERQRQSLDLLVTTPLTAAELLIGKLVSSVAFLGLLLMLSLPASALCVLLGGASIGDVFRIYFLLLLDGVVLAGIGLFFSCAVRTNLLALIWSYVTVAAFLGITYAAGMIGSPHGLTELGTTLPLQFLGGLNPFLAVLPVASQSVSLGIVSLPVWLGALVLGVLILRLLITASTYRLGVYGGASAPAMRRQALILTGLGISLLVYSGYSLNPQNGGWDSVGFGMAMIFLCLFLAGSIFLPALFVPVSAEDAPPGAVASSIPDEARVGVYSIRRAFRPEHAGAMPYFHTLSLVAVTAALTGFVLAVKKMPVEVFCMMMASWVQVIALGFLVWAIARFSAVIVRGVSQARALTFGIFMLFLVGPMLVLALTSGNHSWEQNPLTSLWLLAPMVYSNVSSANSQYVIWGPLCGIHAAIWALAFVGLRAWYVRRVSATVPVN